MTTREKGMLAIKTVIKNPKNINIIENKLWTVSNEDTDQYIHNTYQIIGDVLNGMKLTDIMSNLKNDRIGWMHGSFKTEQDLIDEQDDFIENPFEIEEGVIECRCGSKRVFSFSKQTRSADEPMTTYAECVQCGSKWTYSG